VSRLDRQALEFAIGEMQESRDAWHRVAAQYRATGAGEVHGFAERNAAKLDAVLAVLRASIAEPCLRKLQADMENALAQH
jgi:hypothetical protein